MAYCRWSSNNWKCDLYCYEGADNQFHTHVAGRRRSGDVPDDGWTDFVNGIISAEEYTRLHNQQMAELVKLPLEEINLPHAGEDFMDSSLESFKERLLYLRGVGYHFPDHVLEQIDMEIANADAQERNTG